VTSIQQIPVLQTTNLRWGQISEGVGFKATGRRDRRGLLWSLKPILLSWTNIPLNPFCKFTEGNESYDVSPFSQPWSQYWRTDKLTVTERTDKLGSRSSSWSKSDQRLEWNLIMRSCIWLQKKPPAFFFLPATIVKTVSSVVSAKNNAFKHMEN